MVSINDIITLALCYCVVTPIPKVLRLAKLAVWEVLRAVLVSVAKDVTSK